jgi:hypothetical protein
VFLHAGVYDDVVPEALRDDAVIGMVPVMFQMGVDIKQWGSNLVKNTTKGGGGQGALSVGTGEGGDDEQEVQADLLVALNLEAFQRLNTYAHNIDSFGCKPPTV